MTTDRQNNRQKLQEYRVGRNYIRLGDTVRCQPFSGSRFRAKVTGIYGDADGNVLEVEVYGGKTGRAGFRVFTPDRIERMAQTKAGAEREF